MLKGFDVLCSAVNSKVDNPEDDVFRAGDRWVKHIEFVASFGATVNAASSYEFLLLILNSLEWLQLSIAFHLSA